MSVRFEDFMGKKNLENIFSRSQALNSQLQNGSLELDTPYYSAPDHAGQSDDPLAGGLDRRQLGACGKAIAGASSDMTKATKERGVDFGDVIGKELQNLYDDVVAQPVPDRFLSLLNQLEKNALSTGSPSRAPRERE